MLQTLCNHKIHEYKYHKLSQNHLMVIFNIIIVVH